MTRVIARAMKPGQPTISERLSRTLMVANVIGTILVVAIHYSTRSASNGALSANFLIQEFICNGLARVAVPFFSFAAGLFLAMQYAKGMPYLQALGKRARSVIVPYLVASALFVAFSLSWSALRGHGTPIDAPALFIDMILRPQSFQFWFLRDLILLILISPLLVLRSSILSWVLAAVLLVAWLVDYQPFPLVRDWYLINIETLCFFCVGAAFAHRIEILERIADASRGSVAAAFAIWIGLVAWRVAVDPHFNNWYAVSYTPMSLALYKLAILCGMASLISLSSRIVSPFVLSLQGFTFFVFLFHEYPLHYYMGLALGVAMPSALTFYVALPVGLIILYTTGVLLARYWSSAFNLLTGGRGNRAASMPPLAGALTASK